MAEFPHNPYAASPKEEMVEISKLSPDSAKGLIARTFGLSPTPVITENIFDINGNLRSVGVYKIGGEWQLFLSNGDKEDTIHVLSADATALLKGIQEGVNSSAHQEYREEVSARNDEFLQAAARQMDTGHIQREP